MNQREGKKKNQKEKEKKLKDLKIWKMRGKKKRRK